MGDRPVARPAAQESHGSRRGQVDRGAVLDSRVRAPLAEAVSARGWAHRRPTAMFEVFTLTEIQTSDPEVKINLRHGGPGPGLLLLHGNPLTHVTWHKIAPRLAEHFTVVATDLRGYGRA